MSARFRLGFAAAVCACLLAGSAAAWPCHDYGDGVVHTASLPFSNANCSARMGDRELIGTSTGSFVVLDLSDPLAPTFTDTLALGHSVRAIAVAGSRAYVAADTGGLMVIDVPADGPAVLVGSFVTPAAATDVALDGTTAYVGARDAGVVVLDVTDPAAITHLGTYTPPGTVDSVAFLHGYLVLCATEPYIPRIQSVDMSDPSAGVVVDEIVGSGETYAPHVRAVGDRFASIRVWSMSLGYGTTLKQYSVDYRTIAADGSIVDVSTFTFPQELTSLQSCVPGGAGNIATIGRKYGAVLVNPETAMEIGAVSHGSLTGVAPTIGGGVLVVEAYGSVEVWTAAPGFETAVLQTKSGAASYPSVGVGSDVCVESSFTPDVDDPGLGTMKIQAWAVEGDVLGNQLWQISEMADSGAPIVGFTPASVVVNDDSWGILRILDRATGTETAQLPHARAAAVEGSRVHHVTLAGADYTYQIDDLADPAAPHAKGSVLLPAATDHLALDGGLAYCTGGSAEAAVVDVSDLTAPAVLGQASFPWSPKGLVIRDGFGYAVGVQDGLTVLAVFDLSQPLAPAELGSVVVPDRTVLSGLRGSRLFAVGAGQVVTVDVTTPSAPEIEGYTAIGAVTMAVSDYALVATTARGLSVLAAPCEAAVPTLIAGFTVTHRGGEVTVAWSAPGAGDAPRFRVVAAAGSRSWDVAVDDLGGAYRAVDRVTTGGDVSYAVQLWLDGAWTTVAYETVRVTPTAPTLTLAPATPNPFNPQTTIAYAVAQAGPVSLVVYDLAGRRVATLVDEARPAGPGSVVWDGRDDAGRAMPAGIYAVRLATPTGTRVQKVTMLK